MSLHLKPVWDFLFLAVENILTNRCRQLKLIRESCPVMSDSLRPLGLFSPWNSPGQYTGVGNCSLFQGIFPTQGSNSGLLRCRQILYELSHKGNPRILEWVAYPWDLPSPGIELGSAALQADSLPAEPHGKPKNTGVGSLSLLQQIFLTQESKWGLLHCR